MREGSPDLTRTNRRKSRGSQQVESHRQTTVSSGMDRLLLICGPVKLFSRWRATFWENCRPTSDKCLILPQVRFPSYLSRYSCCYNVLWKKERKKERGKERGKIVEQAKRSSRKYPDRSNIILRESFEPDLCSPLVGFAPTKQRCYLFY